MKEYVRWTVPTIPPLGDFNGNNVCDDDNGDKEPQAGDNDNDEEEDDKEEDGEEVEEDQDDLEDEDEENDNEGYGEDILGEEGNGDGIPKSKNQCKRNKCQCRSPIKSQWLVPLIKERAVSNAEIAANAR